MELCKCGCGNFVKWNKGKKCWNKFIYGHQNRGQNSYWFGKKLSEKHKKKLSLINKDKKLSEETKNKLRKIAKGRKHSEETKIKMKGRKHSEETKEKLSKSHLGKKHSPEAILNMSGANHYNWKGGISCEPYCQDWTEAYKKYIKERDNNRCQNPYCWKLVKILAVHHINYNKKDCVPQNLICLCTSCNTRANYNRRFWVKLYQQIIKEKYKTAA